MSDAKLLLVKYNLYTKHIKQTYDLSQELSHQKEVSANEKTKFLVRYRDLERHRALLDDVYTAILAGQPEPEKQVHIENLYYECMNMFYSIQVAYELFSPAKPMPNLPSTLTAPKASDVEFHLPKIQLARFSGTHIEWPSFIALFNSVIHENARLTPVQKMHYLLSILDKEPLSMVKHLIISEANYGVAYDILTQRYENKRLIADNYVGAILNLPNLTQVNLKTLNKFIGTIKENLQALMVLGFDVTSWSFLLLHIIINKLNSDLRTKFETTIDPHCIPSCRQLTMFLENHLRILENVAGSTLPSAPKVVNVVNADPKVNAYSCTCCGENHAIYYCSKFEAMTPEQRKLFVIQHKLCFNCLRTHHVSKCASQSVCQVCRGRHHTKLHLPRTSSNSATEHKPDEVAVANLSSTVQPQSMHGVDNVSTMVLGTAYVRVQDISGHYQVARALVDSGSQVSIITENLAQKLKLPRTMSGSIIGIGGSAAQPTRGLSTCSISPMRDSTVSMSTDFLIMQKITGQLPSVPVNHSVLQLCHNLVLADKHFTAPGQIDMLLGVDLYDQILDGRKFSLGDNMPTAYSSVFGWIIMGKAPASSQGLVSVNSMTPSTGLNHALTQLSEVEEPPRKTSPDQGSKHLSFTARPPR